MDMAIKNYGHLHPNNLPNMLRRYPFDRATNGEKLMKPLRISRLKYCLLLVAVLVLILTSACSKGPALIDAATNGDVAKVQALLAEGADVNYQDQYGRTALFSAAKRGHTEAVRILLTKGAEVNHKSKAGKTALSMADTKAIAQLLKAAGAKE